MPIDLEAIRVETDELDRCDNGESTPGDGCFIDSGPRCGKHDVSHDSEIKNIRTLIAEVELMRGGLDAAMRQNRHMSESWRGPRWIATSERWPEPKTWFTGLIVSTDRDITSGQPIRVYRLVRGYPKNERPQDLWPDMTHWSPLMEPPK